MLTISPPAYDRLSKMLADRPHDVAVRIFVRDGRARIRPSRQRQGDQVLTHAGRTVLLLDPDAAQYVDQRMIDIRDTANGQRLRLQRVESK